MPKLRGLLFDYNGTILDDKVLAHGAMVETFRIHNLPAPSWEEHRDKTVSYLQFYKKHGIPHDGDDVKFKEMIDNIRFNFIWLNMDKPGLASKFRPNLLRVIRMCDQLELPLGIVSGEDKFLLNYRLRRVGIVRFFKHIQGQAWPDKRPALLEACRALGSTPLETMYVDDTYEGITAADEVGMWTVGILDGYSSEERIAQAEPDFTIKDLDDLAQVFFEGRFRFPAA